MVIEDIFSSSGRENPSPNSWTVDWVAAPAARFAASVIDCFVVLLPMLFLAVSPYRHLLTRAVVLENQVLMAVAMVAIFLTAVGILVIYQTFMVHFFSATLGKMFFSLKVVTIDGRLRPSMLSALIRSLTWVLSLVTGGWMFLSVFSHERRRAFHDRLADTLVISTNRQYVSFPQPLEVRLAKVFFAAVSLFLFTLVLAESARIFRASWQQQQLARVLELEGELCSVVGKSIENWPWPEERLEIAMALFSAGQLEKDCLAAEIDLQFRSGSHSPLVYLANSFVFADRTDVSNAYLEQVCEVAPKSKHCLMSQVVDFWSQDNWSEVDQLLEKVSGQSVYIDIWAIRHYTSRENYEKALERIDSLSPGSEIGPFLLRQRAKVYWGLGRQNEARAVARAAFESLGDDARFELATWLCYEETSLSCAGFEQTSCDIFSQLENDQTFFMDHSRAALAYLRHGACQDKVSDFTKVALRYSDRITDPSTLKFLSAAQSGDREKAAALRELVTDREVDKTVREEGLRYLIGAVKDLSELDDFYQQWLSRGGGLEWKKTGRVFFNNFLKRKVYDRVLAVGEKLLQAEPGDDQLRKELVVAAYKASQKTLAWRLLTSVNSSSREPASDNLFSTIRRDLENQFGGQ